MGGEERSWRFRVDDGDFVDQKIGALGSFDTLGIGPSISG